MKVETGLPLYMSYIRLEALLDERQVIEQWGDRMIGMVLSLGDSLQARAVTASSDCKMQHSLHSIAACVADPLSESPC